jgi:methylated-DNA-protein-cysteine methyltransferase-like protein
MGSRLSSAFRERVYQIVGAIPLGRVMTYGSIAALIPPPPGIDWLAYRRIRARWVGYALAACPDELPWQRVVNGQGRISRRPGHGPHVQRSLLRREGVVFDRQGKVDLERFAWKPGTAWLRARGL